MLTNYIPSRQLDKFIPTHLLQSLNKDIVVFFDEIYIRCYKQVKIKLSKDFLNSVDPETIRVIISPYHCKRTHYIDYYINNGYLYIKTNACLSTNSRYAKLQLAIFGQRWDTLVINDIKQDLER